MSTPTDSVAPAPPTGSSNLWPLWQWFKRICDWIAALSPSGSGEYDTGWVAITPASGFTTSTAAVRRIGKVVYFKGTISGSFTANTTTAIGTVPVGFRPPASDGRSVGAAAATQGLIVYYYGVTSGTGTISVRTSSTATHNIALGGMSGYLVD